MVRFDNHKVCGRLVEARRFGFDIHRAGSRLAEVRRVRVAGLQKFVGSVLTTAKRVKGLLYFLPSVYF